jgi:hypothetical protein
MIRRRSPSTSIAASISFIELRPGIKAEVRKEPNGFGYCVDFRIARVPRGRSPDGRELDEGCVIILVEDDGKLCLGPYTPPEGETSGEAFPDWQALAVMRRTDGPDLRSKIMMGYQEISTAWDIRTSWFRSARRWGLPSILYRHRVVIPPKELVGRRVRVVAWYDHFKTRISTPHYTGVSRKRGIA